VSGPIAAAVTRDVGIQSAVGAPILVGGHLWGVMMALSTEENPLPDDAEARLAAFTELLATAISNTTARTELIESRARIVAAGDEARRRIERNLHDGTQQRLVALGLDIQRVRATIPQGQHDTHLELERLEHDLETVLEDLRELSRGLHPPLLARRGLRSSLRALARDSPIPVELEIGLPERPPAPLEIAIYYVVSEALTNAIKHSQASAISITVESDHAGEPFGVGRGRGAKLHATIADNGVGGADARPAPASLASPTASRRSAAGSRSTRPAAAAHASRSSCRSKPANRSARRGTPGSVSSSLGTGQKPDRPAPARRDTGRARTTAGHTDREDMCGNSRLWPASCGDSRAGCARDEMRPAVVCA
jgi:anti-sigma regulatory factor (Ser/Thr protein kinase)